MKKFYLVLISIFLVFTVSAAWADSIDQVAISEGPPVVLEITGTFACDDGLRAPFTLQTSENHRIMIQIFTNPPQTCAAQNVPFTIYEEIVPPEQGGYEIIVFLYSGVPGIDELVALEDTERIIVQEERNTLVNIHPNTINLKRRGQFISATIWMPEGFNLEDITPEFFKLYLVKENDELSESIPGQRVMVDMFEDGLNVKFSNQAVLSLIKANVSEFPSTVEFLVQWQLQGDDTVYEGTDNVRVINPGKSEDQKEKPDKVQDKNKKPDKVKDKNKD